MLRSLLGAALLGALAPVCALAGPVEDRIDALEKNQAELFHTLQEKKEGEPGLRLADRLTFSGLLEIVASFARERDRQGGREDESDLRAKTAQVGLDVKIHEALKAHVVVLFEEQETDPPEVDEATLDYSAGPWSARAGRQYVPFGTFVNHFIDKPLTQELGETRETAALAGYRGGALSATAFVAGGDAARAGRSEEAKRRLDDWGATARLAPAEGVEVVASFLSDLADTDAELVRTFRGDNSNYRRRVGGWSAHAAVALGPAKVSAEVLGAVWRFAPEDLDADGNGRGDRPLAWDVEAAWEVRPHVELAARIEGSREFLGHPRTQWGLAASWAVAEKVTLSAEYLRGEFERGFGGGTRSRDLVATRLAAAF